MTNRDESPERPASKSHADRETRAAAGAPGASVGGAPISPLPTGQLPTSEIGYNFLLSPDGTAAQFLLAGTKPRYPVCLDALAYQPESPLVGLVVDGMTDSKCPIWKAKKLDGSPLLSSDLPSGLLMRALIEELPKVFAQDQSETTYSIGCDRRLARSDCQDIRSLIKWLALRAHLPNSKDPVLLGDGDIESLQGDLKPGYSLSNNLLLAERGYEVSVDDGDLGKLKKCDGAAILAALDKKETERYVNGWVRYGLSSLGLSLGWNRPRLLKDCFKKLENLSPQQVADRIFYPNFDTAMARRAVRIKMREAIEHVLRKGNESTPSAIKQLSQSFSPDRLHQLFESTSSSDWLWKSNLGRMLAGANLAAIYHRSDGSVALIGMGTSVAGYVNEKQGLNSTGLPRHFGPSIIISDRLGIYTSEFTAPISVVLIPKEQVKDSRFFIVTDGTLVRTEALDDWGQGKGINGRDVGSLARSILDYTWDAERADPNPEFDDKALLVLDGASLRR